MKRTSASHATADFTALAAKTATTTGTQEEWSALQTKHFPTLGLIQKQIVVFASQEPCFCTRKRKMEESIVHLVQVIWVMALRCALVAKIAFTHTTGGWNALLGQDFIGWDTKVSNVCLFKEREANAWRSHLSINLQISREF